MNILVVAAHPDDESLGCGATIAAHAKAGDAVHVIIAAQGVTSRDKRPNLKKRKTELTRLNKAATQANKILGTASLRFLGFPDNRLDSMDLIDIVKPIEEAVAQLKPSIVYTHHAGDVNIDHQKVHQAVITACRPMPSHPVKTLLFFEVPSSTEWRPTSSSRQFEPNWFSDVSQTLEFKCQALKAYHAEMRPWPHARSIKAVEHLARWRGATVGVQAAEAFVLGRTLVKRHG